MRKIKDAITDSAIANGYDGDTPKTIAQAVGAFAGVAGGGSGGGGGGYSYSSAITDLVHEQTINIVEGTGDDAGTNSSLITVDTQACAGIDGVTSESGVDVTCVIDGTKYKANVAGWEVDNQVFCEIQVFDNDILDDPFVEPFASIGGNLDDEYIINVFGTEVVGLGNHVIRIYHEDAVATFDKPFIELLKNAIGDFSNVFVVHGLQDIYDNVTLDHTPEEIRQAYNEGRRIFFNLPGMEPMPVDNISFVMDGAGGTTSKTLEFDSDAFNVSNSEVSPTDFYLTFNHFEATNNNASTILVGTSRSYRIVPTSIEEVQY